MKEMKEVTESQAKLKEICVKSCVDILDMKKTKDENSVALKILEDKIDKIDKELKFIKKKNEDKDKEKVSRSNYEIKCKLCDESFNRNSDLESHIKLSHEDHEVFQCQQCDKCFVLNWRLQKHIKLHSEEPVKTCHYFNNGRTCPFEELGCKFLHQEAKICTLGQNCNRRLCPFRHCNKELHNHSDSNLV